MTRLCIVAGVLLHHGAGAAEQNVSRGGDLAAIVNAAKAGDVLALGPGEYRGGTLTRDGVVIKAHGEALVRGKLTLRANRVTLEGLTWEGQEDKLLEIRGAHNTVRRCAFRRFGLKKPTKAIWIRETGDYGGNLIEECLFEDWGGKTYHSSCIKVGQNTNPEAHKGTIIRNCTFRRGAVGGNNAAVQPFCAATMEGNTIHDCEDGFEIKGSHMVVRDNVVFRCAGGEPMSNRFGSKNLFEGNLIYDCPVIGWQIWSGKGNVWRNNIVVNCGRIAEIKGHDDVTRRAEDDLIVNNTFVGCERGITWHNRKHAGIGIRIYNNIFVGESGHPAIESARQGESAAEYIEDYNLIFGYAAPVGKTRGPHTILGEAPQFENAAEHDFRLRPSSPGIDAGSSDVAFMPETDRQGNPRPRGQGADIGAYER